MVFILDPICICPKSEEKTTYDEIRALNGGIRQTKEVAYPHM